MCTLVEVYLVILILISTILNPETVPRILTIPKDLYKYFNFKQNKPRA